MSDAMDRSVDESPAGLQSRRRFEALCLPFKADLYRFIFWLCRNRALTEDVMQETYLAAFRHLDGFAGRARFSSWLVRIVSSEIVR